MTIDFNTMSLEGCQDFLAEKRGYVWKETKNTAYRKGTGSWSRNDELISDVLVNRYGMYHPIQATLDEAAKLPEGFHFVDISFRHSERYINPGWIVFATEFHPNGDNSYDARGETELLARFRLRCMIEENNEQP